MLICEMCGIKKKLDAHHLDGNITNNTQKNIRTLCHNCHMKLHWQQRRYGKGTSKTETKD